MATYRLHVESTDPDDIIDIVSLAAVHMYSIEPEYRSCRTEQLVTALDLFLSNLTDWMADRLSNDALEPEQVTDIIRSLRNTARLIERDFVGRAE